MACRPDPFYLGLKGSVEVVLVNFFIFNERVLCNQLAELFWSDEVVLLAVLRGALEVAEMENSIESLYIPRI